METPKLASVMGGKKELEIKVSESCNRSELISTFASPLGDLCTLLTWICCTQQVFGPRQTFVIPWRICLLTFTSTHV